MKKVIGFLIVICSLFCTSAYAKQIIDADIEADTYVQGGNYKANNFGSDTVICAKRETSNGLSGNTDRRAYMKINLSKYSDALGRAESIIVSATTVDTAEGFVYATDWTDWQEDTFTMNDEPYSAYADIESGYTYIGAVTAAKNKRISIDVTAYAKSLLENNKTEFTLVFIGDNNSNVTKRTNLRIYSRESSYVPKITMEFSAAACLESCARQSDSIKAVYSYVNPEAENKKISAIAAGYTLKNGERTLSGIKYREYSTDDVCGKITVSEDISGIEADEWVCMLWSDMAPMCEAAKIENISKLEVLAPEADSYTISASSNNYGAENVLYCGKSGSALRKSYLMFDLSSLESANISDAYLIMTVKASEKTDGTSIYANEAASSAWTEEGINADSAPESGGRIAVSRMLKGMTCLFDFTDYIKTQLSANKGKITVVISDNGLSGLTTFASREDEENTPKLVISYGDSFCYPKAENSEFNYNDTDPIENAKAMTAKSKAVYGSDISYSTSVDDSDYTERVSAKKLVSQSYYTSYKTRTLESLSGFDASDSTEDLCEYGGLKRKTHKATGYYYISKQKGMMLMY